MCGLRGASGRRVRLASWGRSLRTDRQKWSSRLRRRAWEWEGWNCAPAPGVRRRRQERGQRSRSHGSGETHANQPPASSVPGGRSLQPQEAQGVVHADMFLSRFFLSLSWQSSLWLSPGNLLDLDASSCAEPQPQREASGFSVLLTFVDHSRFGDAVVIKWLLKCQTRIYTGGRPKRHPVRPKCNSAHLKDVCCPLCTWQLTCRTPLRTVPR